MERVELRYPDAIPFLFQASQDFCQPLKLSSRFRMMIQDTKEDLVAS
jgi:hypothetical protein